ncbi:hypothetical protein, partial [Methanimicrococcus hacksteinii]|uniref:hypothetical protein n=1 Tax=Methanimicrococcus hacksteinii TaxID=3028293 RepID=UPI00298F2B69
MHHLIFSTSVRYANVGTDYLQVFVWHGYLQVSVWHRLPSGFRLAQITFRFPFGTDYLQVSVWHRLPSGFRLAQITFRFP